MNGATQLSEKMEVVQEMMSFPKEKLLETMLKMQVRISELEKDAERLDWVIYNGTYQGCANGFTLSVFIPIDCEDVTTAIDAAMQTKPPTEAQA